MVSSKEMAKLIDLAAVLAKESNRRDVRRGEGIGIARGISHRSIVRDDAGGVRERRVSNWSAAHRQAGVKLLRSRQRRKGRSGSAWPGLRSGDRPGCGSRTRTRTKGWIDFIPYQELICKVPVWHTKCTIPGQKWHPSIHALDPCTRSVHSENAIQRCTWREDSRLFLSVDLGTAP